MSLLAKVPPPELTADALTTMAVEALPELTPLPEPTLTMLPPPKPPSPPKPSPSPGPLPFPKGACGHGSGRNRWRAEGRANPRGIQGGAGAATIREALRLSICHHPTCSMLG